MTKGAYPAFFRKSKTCIFCELTLKACEAIRISPLHMKLVLQVPHIEQTVKQVWAQEFATYLMYLTTVIRSIKCAQRCYACHSGQMCCLCALSVLRFLLEFRTSTKKFWFFSHFPFLLAALLLKSGSASQRKDW